jgi:hypothetical protein
MLNEDKASLSNPSTPPASAQVIGVVGGGSDPKSYDEPAWSKDTTINPYSFGDLKTPAIVSPVPGLEPEASRATGVRPEQLTRDDLSESLRRCAKTSASFVGLASLGATSMLISSFGLALRPVPSWLHAFQSAAFYAGAFLTGVSACVAVTTFWIATKLYCEVNNERN